jgi:hypothetical protein
MLANRLVNFSGASAKSVEAAASANSVSPRRTDF